MKKYIQVGDIGCVVLGVMQHHDLGTNERLECIKVVRQVWKGVLEPE